MAETTLADALFAGDSEALERLIDERATFRSPVATYEGMPQIVALLSTVIGVVEDPKPTSVLSGPAGTATFFSTAVDSRPADGVLYVEPGADGMALRITLMLRPLEALLLAVEKMRRALEGNGPAPG